MGSLERSIPYRWRNIAYDLWRPQNNGRLVWSELLMDDLNYDKRNHNDQKPMSRLRNGFCNRHFHRSQNLWHSRPRRLDQYTAIWYGQEESVSLSYSPAIHIHNQNESIKFTNGVDTWCSNISLPFFCVPYLQVPAPSFWTSSSEVEFGNPLWLWNSTNKSQKSYV